MSDRYGKLPFSLCRSIALSTCLFVVNSHEVSAVLAFPGAVGQGAVATGGRGGDVYHVTTLLDYAPGRDESEIPGSLRYGLLSVTGPRTIVFDVAGAIELREPLRIGASDLTIAGQTSPGGITIWGYPVDVRASNLIIRYLRFRTGDFNAKGQTSEADEPPAGNGNRDLDPTAANTIGIRQSDRVIIDHVSAAWGMDETLSVTRSRNVTVQHSIIAESLNKSFHPKGPHGYGTLIRGELTAEDQKEGIGGYTFFGNLWAFHRARNPSIGGQQSLDAEQLEADRRRTDVNLVNNVVYGWGEQPTHRSENGEVRVNLVSNYYVNGAAKKSNYIFNENNPARTFVYQRDNMHDANQNANHDGVAVGRASDTRHTFRGFDKQDMLAGATHGKPFNFFSTVADEVLTADQAYSRVIQAAGASLTRDVIDSRIIDSVVHRKGSLIDSQQVFHDSHGKLAGIDDLPAEKRTAEFDTDGDGIPNDFEQRRGLNPDDFADGNLTTLSDVGYTNLEVYLNSLGF